MVDVARSGGPSGPTVLDPLTGVGFYELSHPWGHGVPTFPGYEDVNIFRSVNHAVHGVMSQRVRTVMHTGTHVNAPKHLVQRAVGIGEMPLETFFGTGIVLDVPKGEWELVTADDLERAGADVQKDDIVLIVTGWHRKYSDSQEYFAHSPGLALDAATWLIERGVKLVGVDTAQIDHPLATSLGLHRNGPLTKYLPKRYEEKTGRKPADDFPDWNPAHRALLAAGIPTIENVGGDVDALLGRRATMQAFPWRFVGGDACGVRLTGIVDTRGDFRIETGDRS